MGLSGDDEPLRGSFAARDLAERVMIEAAERAALEKRDPARMLRVLALLASPVYDSQNPETAPVHLDLRAEWHFLAQGVRESKAPILLARLGLATLPALRSALSPRAAEQSAFPHVLHFSGHAWKEGLVFEDELGQAHLAGTAEVVDALKDMPGKIDLVVLNGCESAAEAHSVAQALLDGGLARSVVGHERSVLDSEAVAFAARLYAELCGGFTLKRALDNACKEITTHKVICLGDEELRFEGLCGGNPLIDERHPRGSLLPQAKLFLGRGRELVDIARALAKPPAAIILSGPPGMGKSSLVLEAALRSGWRFPGGVAYAAGPRPEEARAASAEGLLAALAGEMGLEIVEDLFRYTAMQPTLLLLDNLDSLAGEEQVLLRERLRRLGSESAAILALRPSSKILEELPSARSIALLDGLALAEAVEYARFQADQRKIPLTPEKALIIARAVGGHPRLLEQIVAQARRQDLDGLLDDVAKREGDYADKIEEVYSWCAARLDPEGEAAWRALPLFPGGNAPEAVLKAAAGEEGPHKLREAALADFDQAGQLWRWHSTVAEYARGHWPFTPAEQKMRKVALLPAWERWLKRLPAGEQRTHVRLEASRPNLESAAEECAGYSRQEAGAFLDVLEGRLPQADRTLTLRDMKEMVLRVELILLPKEEMTERARLLGNLGVALSALGRREEALEVAREAADIYRTLAEKNPQAFLPGLAMSLNNLGGILSNLGRLQDALEVAREAADIRRKLAETNPQVFLPGLAGSLNNLGLGLSDLGRREEALDAAREAADICRTLAEKNPQAFLPDLAKSLNNLGKMLSNLGRLQEALEVAREAADIYRTLAEKNPQAFLPDLAMSLNNLGLGLSDLGRLQEALEAAREAADIYRTLAEKNPQAFLPDLAMSLNNLGNRLSDLGRLQEALEVAREAADIYRTLAEKNPQAFLPNLAGSLNNLGNRLSDLGRLQEALKAAREAVDICRTLAEKNPQAFLPNLAMSLNNLGLMHSDLGRREDALAAAQEAADIYRKLAEKNPQAFLPDLAMSLGVHGNALLGLERFGEAARAFSEGLEHLAPFFQELPQAFSDLAGVLKQLYMDACQKAGMEPDGELLSRFD
jgi:hypothetical protein